MASHAQYPTEGDSSSSLHDEKRADAVEYAEKAVHDPNSSKASGPLSDDDRAWLANVDIKTQSKIYHKVDVRLVPMLAILYLIAHLDRASEFSQPEEACLSYLRQCPNVSGRHRQRED